GRRVGLRALGDPLLDEVDLVGGERILAARHLRRFAVVAGDLLDDKALVGLAGDDAGFVGVALVEQLLVVGHDEAALGLGGLMATLAVLLEKRADVLVLADDLGHLVLVVLFVL